MCLCTGDLPRSCRHEGQECSVPTSRLNFSVSRHVARLLWRRIERNDRIVPVLWLNRHVTRQIFTLGHERQAIRSCRGSSGRSTIDVPET